MDLADGLAVKAAVATVERELGPISLLFWNAAAWPVTLLEATPEDVTTALNTSITGAATLFVSVRSPCCFLL